MDTKKFVELRWVHYVYEFFIVVVGISVPFLLDRWNDQRIENKAERENYKYILQELREDENELQHVAEYNQYYLERAQKANNIIVADDRKLADSLGHLAIELRYVSDFHRNHGIYENLINSEKIKLIKNDVLINQLQELEELYTYLNRLENNHLESMINFVIPKLSQYIRLVPFKVADEEALFDFPFHNIILLYLSIMEEKADLYQRTLGKISEIRASVEKQLQRK